VHFFHDDFTRCKIVDSHLSKLCLKYTSTKFVRLNAGKAPFFIDKLKIRILPAIMLFRGGVNFDRIVGFEELGSRDDFRTEVLEQRLLQAGVVKKLREEEEAEEEEEEEERGGGGRR
jgi:thioredoxin-like negative regulator of GroEL